MAKVNHIPPGFHTVTPHIMVSSAEDAIAFYKEAFGAEEVMVMPGPGGKGVMHAEIKIGDSMIMLGEDMPQMKYWVSPTQLKGTTVGLAIYVPDVDKAFDKAIKAGAKVSMPVADMFWGDRYGKLTDPFGHEWAIATHKQDLTPEQIAKGAEEFFKQMAKHGGGCGG